MSRFQIGIFEYEKNPHMRCFEEFARSLAAALRALGHEVAAASPSGKGRLIMVGGNNGSYDPADQQIKDAIIYNSEQLAAIRTPQAFMQNYAQYRNHVIWDYSEANIAAMRRLGITRAVHCPLGYVGEEHSSLFLPARPRVPFVEEQDIDVLFYGSIRGPRREILDALDKVEGLRVARLFNIYGDQRDAYIARSKVVLNLHFYPHGVFEIFRVSYLLENRKCVVTEAGGCDEGLEEFAERACAYVPRDQIVEKCVLLASDKVARQHFEYQGHEEFKKIDFVESVRRALEQS